MHTNTFFNQGNKNTLKTCQFERHQSKKIKANPKNYNKKIK